MTPEGKAMLGLVVEQLDQLLNQVKAFHFGAFTELEEERVWAGWELLNKAHVHFYATMRGKK